MLVNSTGEAVEENYIYNFQSGRRKSISKKTKTEKRSGNPLQNTK